MAGSMVCRRCNAWYIESNCGMKFFNLTSRATPWSLLFCLRGVLLLALLPLLNTRAQDWEYLGLPNETITNVVVRGLDTIYASIPRLIGVTDGLIYRTTNGGSDWDTVFYPAGVLELKIHPRDPSILYAGLGGLYPPYGILKTTDGGGVWFHADSGIVLGGDLPVRAIEFNPLTPETLYAGTSGSGGDFYKSTNGGIIWSQIDFPDGVSAIAVDPFVPETIYAGTIGAGLLQKSIDGGNSWMPTGLQGYSVISLGVDPVNHAFVYAGVSTDGGGLQKSTDGGATWAIANSGLPPQSQPGEFLFDPTTGTIYAAVGGVGDVGGIYQSTDGGGKWILMPGLPEGNRFKSLAASSGFQNFYVSVIDSGIYRTDFVTGVSHQTEVSPSKPFTLARAYPNPFNGETKIQFCN